MSPKEKRIQPVKYRSVKILKIDGKSIMKVKKLIQDGVEEIRYSRKFVKEMQKPKIYFSTALSQNQLKKICEIISQ